MKFLKKILSDNRADMHMERLIIIVIAFVAGAIFIGGIIMALRGNFHNGMQTHIHEYLVD